MSQTAALPETPDRAADRPVVGVAGLGTMGLGIAQVFAQAGHVVLATDAQPAARLTARGRMAEGLAARVEAGRMEGTERDAILSRLVVVDDPARLAPARMVVEAIVETRSAKTELIAALENSLARDAVIATNTSSLPVGGLAAQMRHPERLIGLHFFNPAPAMRLVELVAPDGAAIAAVDFARRITEGAGKTVVQAPDRPGFIVNRCARPFYGEALAMLEEGRSGSDIDAAMLAAGYRIGPLSLIDLIGADVNLAATEGLSAAMAGHPRYHVFPTLRETVAQGNLGRKSGRGLIYPDRPGAAPGDADMIALRIEATLANEAAHLLEEGGITRDGIDVAMKLGLNFPRGPFESLERHGVPAVLATLARLEDGAPARLKGRYTPTRALTEAR